MTTIESQETAPATLSPTRPMYWSIRREIWENRSIYLAPLIVAGVVLFATLINAMMLPRRMQTLRGMSEAKLSEALNMPFSGIAGTLIMTAFLIGAFYCLDALQGERRDRSILFWKSLPVSDRTTVLAKAAIPMLVLPALIFVMAMAARLTLLLVSTLAMATTDGGVALLWRHVHFFQTPLVFLYGVVIIALWHAPVYAWLLMVSAWARRAPVLWAILPLLAVAAVERTIFGSTHFMHIVGLRMTGWFKRGFYFPPKGSGIVLEPVQHMTPLKLLASPGLWLGLIFAALFIAVAIHLRRNREPV